MDISAPLTTLNGVGPKTGAALAAAGLDTIADLIYFLPRRYEDFTTQHAIAQLRPGKVTISATVEACNTRTVRRGLRITTATLADASGKLKAVWFNQPYRQNQLRLGEQFLFSGTFEFTYNHYQLTNPAVEKAQPPSDAPDVRTTPSATITPVYRAIKGVRARDIHRLLESIRPTITMLADTLPPRVAQSQQLLPLSQALLAMHFPTSQHDITQARERLAFEELFELTLASLRNKHANQQLTGYKLAADLNALRELVTGLPFTLTNAQRKAAWQIIQDLATTTPMNRLLQGDVGSGKTIVAGLAAYVVARAGYQTALMAPTEILARQHAHSLAKLLEPYGVQVVLLTGSVKGTQRQACLDAVRSGAAQLIIGTHALIQKTVQFNGLALAIIDEQHRFGVAQRQALLAKAPRMPHLLSMTATPIPRSLQLTVFGELDISILDELPAGRKPIVTKLWAPTNTAALYQAIDDQLAQGRQAYIICRLIDENPDNDTKSVEAEYNRLKSTIFRHRRIGVLHGGMPPADKDAVMAEFAAGKLDILVSTTVVEVGVNVPNASVILIENADHFGLSQLHQLRGRVGRGDHQSYCHLVLTSHQKPSQRLREIERSNDGFHLAQVDLELRGPGEIYGKAQHGALNLQVANLADTKLIARAQKAAQDFIKSGENLLQYKQLAGRVAHYQRMTTLN